MVNSSISSIEIRYANSYEEAVRWLNQGFEPVECSFGPKSVLGQWKLDHHGECAHEEPVSSKAARIAKEPDFSPRKKWVVTGMPDGDAVYAILTLSGLIEPDLAIGEAIAVLDLDPIGIDRTKGDYIREVIFQMQGTKRNSLEGYIEACEQGIIAFSPAQLNSELIAQALTWEAERIARARDSIIQRGDDILLVHSDDASRDVWHETATVVVQFKPTNRVITFSGRSAKGAERLGLESIFQKIGSEGLNTYYGMLGEVLQGQCGGRPDIGGSPRGKVCSVKEAERTYLELQKVL